MKSIIKTISTYIFIVFGINVSAQNSGTWNLTDSLNIPRQHAASVELSNGNILVSGGVDSKAHRDAEIFDYHTEKWQIVKPMNEGRAYHRLVKLISGNVLAIGGTYKSKGCEIYDPDKNLWAITDSLNFERTYGETATILDNDNVLVVGGVAQTLGETKTLGSCEIFDVNTKKWEMTNSLKIVRSYHTATKLLNGMILITGGFSGSSGGYLNDCELFDPQSGKWTEVAPLNIGRSEHSAILLSDGNVLVTGGINFSNNQFNWLNSCELYDPIKNTWTIVNPLLSPRNYHSSLLLDNGLLLICGGGTGNDTWELYNPNNFSNVHIENYPDKQGIPLINSLPNGRILSSGGMAWTDTSGVPISYQSKVCYLYKPGIIDEIDVANNYIINDYRLYQNYPNPFNPETIIRYQIVKSGPVSIKVYDITGRKIKTIVNEEKNRGRYEVKFNASRLSSGIYFYKITSSSYNDVKKMILMK